MLPEWKKLPTDWIRSKQENSNVLRSMYWSNNGASNISALMLYIVLSQNANSSPDKKFNEVGCCFITYDTFSDITGLSRSLISKGLNTLIEFDLITKNHLGKQSHYKIKNYEKSKWGKVPYAGLYDNAGKEINAFSSFSLRKKIELNALKLYLLYIAFRDSNTNYASISYTKISEYTGLTRNEISHANSFLVALHLIEIRVGESIKELNKPMNIYRINHINPYHHSGSRPNLR